MKRTIQINWDYAVEYISIDFDNISQTISTVEYRPDLDIHYKYKARLISFNETPSSWQLTLHYAPLENKHIPKDEAYWGTSTISSTKVGATSGTASWSDDLDSQNDGKTKWFFLVDEMFKKPESETITRFKRNQGQFKAALLALDLECALTGETTVAALEAAHIIPSKEHGAEVPTNGLLLRADIHRLYDAGLINIDNSGKITLHQSLSPEYKKIINKKKLSPSIYARIEKALDYKNNKPAEK